MSKQKHNLSVSLNDRMQKIEQVSLTTKHKQDEVFTSEIAQDVKRQKRFKFCSEGWQKARGGGLKTEWKMIGMKICTQHRGTFKEKKAVNLRSTSSLQLLVLINAYCIDGKVGDQILP